MSLVADVQCLHPGDDLPAPVLELLSAGEVECYEFGATWWTVFSRHAIEDAEGARLLVCWRDGVALAAMAVCLHVPPLRKGGMCGALSNYYTSLYSPQLSPQAGLTELVALVGYLRTAATAPGGRMQFSPLDGGSRAAHLLREALAACGYWIVEQPSHVNWYLPVAQDWAQYLASRPGELRNTIARKTRTLLKSGGRLEIVEAEDACATALDAYSTVYARSWKQPEPCLDFVPTLVAMCARRGWLRLGIAWHEDRPIAAQIWVVAHGKASIFKLAYDEQYAKLAPGTLLTAHMMRHVIEVDRVREVDYLIGNDAYKAHWMTHQRQRVSLVAYDRHRLQGWIGVARAVVSRWRRKAAVEGANPLPHGRPRR